MVRWPEITSEPAAVIYCIHTRTQAATYRKAYTLSLPHKCYKLRYLFIPVQPQYIKLTETWQRLYKRASVFLRHHTFSTPYHLCVCVHRNTLWVRVERERHWKGKNVALLSTKNTWASCGQMQAASYTRRQAAIEWEMLGFEPMNVYTYAGKKYNIDKDTKRSRLMIHSHIKLYSYHTNRKRGGHALFLSYKEKTLRPCFISIVQIENVADFALFLSYKK